VSAVLAPEERSRLEEVAYEIRRLTIELVAYGQWGHIAGSVSMAELLATLYFRSARLNRPAHAGRSAIGCTVQGARLSGTVRRPLTTRLLPDRRTL